MSNAKFPSVPRKLTWGEGATTHHYLQKKPSIASKAFMDNFLVKPQRSRPEDYCELGNIPFKNNRHAAYILTWLGLRCERNVSQHQPSILANEYSCYTAGLQRLFQPSVQKKIQRKKFLSQRQRVGLVYEIKLLCMQQRSKFIILSVEAGNRMKLTGLRLHQVWNYTKIPIAQTVISKINNKIKRRKDAKIPTEIHIHLLHHFPTYCLTLTLSNIVSILYVTRPDLSQRC